MAGRRTAQQVGTSRIGVKRREPPPLEHRNEVVLAGRLKEAPRVKTLPSGDEIVTWRLVVSRPRPLVTRQSSDWVDCVAFGARIRRAAVKWEADDVIEVHGALRRRLWRVPNGVTSICEVDVARATKLTAVPSVERGA